MHLCSARVYNSDLEIEEGSSCAHIYAGRSTVFETVAVVGATGAVGRIMCRLLEQRALPVGTYRFLASKRSAGKTLTFAGKEYQLEELTHV